MKIKQFYINMQNKTLFDKKSLFQRVSLKITNKKNKKNSKQSLDSKFDSKSITHFYVSILYH